MKRLCNKLNSHHNTFSNKCFFPNRRRFFTTLQRPIKIFNNSITIENQPHTTYTQTSERDLVINLSAIKEEEEREIKIFENEKLITGYHVDSCCTESVRNENDYLHLNVRVLPNGAIMIDGIFSDNESTCKKPYQDSNCEGVRFQPMFLSNAANQRNLEGMGLFDRGVHFSGWITPTNIRSICVCDSCEKSFSLRHFHTGFSNSEYFYSKDGKQTLVASVGRLGKTPQEMDEKLEASGYGNFKYYNPLCCPHCGSKFIDFTTAGKAVKQKEYYGNYFLNTEPIYWKQNKD